LRLRDSSVYRTLVATKQKGNAMANKCIAALVTASVLLLPVAANAACVQLDMLGTWQIYAFNTQDQSIRCTLNINANGGIANTTCIVTRDSKPDQTAQLTQGKVTLVAPAICKFTAEWMVNGQVKNTVEHATLHMTTKDAGSGVGRAGLARFVFDIIKVR